MAAIDTREQAKQLVDDLSDEKLPLALGFLSYLRHLEAGGQARLEETYPWTQGFSEGERQAFLAELLQATRDAAADGNWDAVREVIESWQETAEVLADDELTAQIRAAEESIRRGEGVPWETVKTNAA
jgi:hypothetical protein